MSEGVSKVMSMTHLKEGRSSPQANSNSNSLSLSHYYYRASA